MMHAVNSAGGVFSHHQTPRPRFPSQSVIDCYSILSTRPPWTHRRCNTHCEASIAAYLRMTFFTSTIPMPTSVTSMDHCDVHRRLAQHSAWMTWWSHPAPDEHVDHVSRLPVSVAIYNYDDLTSELSVALPSVEFLSDGSCARYHFGRGVLGQGGSSRRAYPRLCCNKTHRDDDMDKDVSSIFHSVHFLEVHCKQLTNMDAFLEFVTSDTPKPAPNTASSNHAASDSPDPSSTP